MKDQPLVLVINDVPPMVRLIELELGFQGMKTEHVLVDEDPVAKAKELNPDAIVLGSVLPTPLQFDILASLAGEVPAPVVFINGGGIDADTTIALEMGAAEVVGKPFSPDDLGLRLRSLLGLVPSDETQIRRGPLKIDVLRRSVWNKDRRVALGTNERGLLLALSGNSESVPAAELLTVVWGDAYAEDYRFLRLWMDRLRVNLSDDPQNPHLIFGDIEHGYRLID